MEYHRLSEMNRVMQCYGSTVMNVAPIYPPSSVSKVEGEAAHYLAKALFREELTIEAAFTAQAPNGYFYTNEMIDNVAAYLNEITISKELSQFDDVDVECSFGGADWAVTGRADHIALCGSTLYVDAFHYGFRLVSVEENWSLIGAAIGFCINHNKQPSTIVFTVHQPRGFRPNSVPAQVAMEYADLLKCYGTIAEHFGKKKRFCQTGRACATCPFSYACAAFNSASMNAIDVAEEPLPQEPKGEELSNLLDELERASEVLSVRLKSLRELANHQISSGQIVPNWTLESSTTPMKWNPGLTPEMMLAITGYDISKPGTITPAQAKKLFSMPETVLKAFAKREQTAPKLTRVEADKQAARIFGKGKPK